MNLVEELARELFYKADDWDEEWDELDISIKEPFMEEARLTVQSSLLPKSGTFTEGSK